MFSWLRVVSPPWGCPVWRCHTLDLPKIEIIWFPVILCYTLQCLSHISSDLGVVYLWLAIFPVACWSSVLRASIHVLVRSLWQADHISAEHFLCHHRLPSGRSTMLWHSNRLLHYLSNLLWCFEWSKRKSTKFVPPTPGMSVQLSMVVVTLLWCGRVDVALRLQPSLRLPIKGNSTHSTWPLLSRFLIHFG